MRKPAVRLRIRDLPGGPVAWVSIDNQSKLNVLGGGLARRLSAALDQLEASRSIRALVLRGEGSRAFIGGADLREMAELDAASARAFILDLHGVCRRLRDFPVPTLARIEGYCLGAGMEVAASCDLRAASPDSQFGMPEVRVGVPSVIEAALLPQLVGWGRTRELLLTGDIVNAQAALDMGFIQRLVPAADLDDAIEGWLASILSAGPVAVRDQKELFRLWERASLPRAIREGVRFFARAYRTDEPKRMMRAFLDGRSSQRRD